MNKNTSSNLEQRIKSLKSVILDNPHENNMYNDRNLGETKEVLISSFSPTSIDSESIASISCQIEGGIKVTPGSLRATAGTFTNSETGQIILASSVIITDPQNYSSVQIVTTGLPAGHYAITIILDSIDASGDTYRLTAEEDLDVRPKVDSIKIMSITPARVTLGELKHTTFAIKGRCLDQISTSTGFYLQTPGFKFNYSGILQPTSINVIYRSAFIPDVAGYRIMARSKDGEAVFSSARLTITE